MKYPGARFFNDFVGYRHLLVPGLALDFDPFNGKQSTSNTRKESFKNSLIQMVLLQFLGKSSPEVLTYSSYKQVTFPQAIKIVYLLRFCYLFFH
jgi:hypothetical protein